MLVIIINILQLIIASNNCDDQLMTRNIRRQMFFLVDKKIKNKEFILLENAAKDLYAYFRKGIFVDINKIEITICHVYKDCKTNHNFTYTADKLAVDDPDLFNIFSFFKSLNVERVFLSTSYYISHFFKTENGSFILADFMNKLSARNGGPEFVYDTVYPIFSYFHRNKRCINPYCSAITEYRQNFGKLDFCITNDNKTGYVFSIDWGQLDYSDFLKKKIKLLYNDNWQPVYNFLLNFDIVKSMAFCSLIEKFYTFYRQMKRTNNFPIGTFIKVTEENIIFHERFIYAVELDKLVGVKINFTTYEDFKQLRSQLLSLPLDRSKWAMFTLFSLSGKPLVICLVKRILYSNLSAKKIFFLEVLFSIGLIERSDINWFLASILEKSEICIFRTLNESYITKIVESIMNIELRDRTSYEYIYFYIIVYFEFEIYVDECETAKDKIFTLLKNYYKLLEVKNVCKDFIDCSKTTVDNICHTYWGLMKNLNMILFCSSNKTSFNEYYCLVETVLSDLSKNEDFIKKFLRN